MSVFSKVASAQFLAMGGYGAYVWPVYGLAVLVLGGVTLLSWRGAHRARRRLADMQGDGQALSPRGDGSKT